MKLKKICSFNNYDSTKYITEITFYSIWNSSDLIGFQIVQTFPNSIRNSNNYYSVRVELYEFELGCPYQLDLLNPVDCVFLFERFIESYSIAEWFFQSFCSFANYFLQTSPNGRYSVFNETTDLMPFWE